MPAGRPKKVDPGTLYTFAHLFYWDFRKLAEGTYRLRLDQTEYDHLASHMDDVQVSAYDKAHLRKVVDNEIRSGGTPEDKRQERLRDLETSQLGVNREDFLNRAVEMARKQLKVPGEPDILRDLLQATTPNQIQKICNDAFVEREIETERGRTAAVRMRNWPISPGSVLPMYLARHAAEFIAAKSDRRFPKSGRPSSELKQLWFLSRALAGALYGVHTRTAINLVGSKRPEEIFQESRAGKPKRRRQNRPAKGH